MPCTAVASAGWASRIPRRWSLILRILPDGCVVGAPPLLGQLRQTPLSSERGAGPGPIYANQLIYGFLIHRPEGLLEPAYHEVKVFLALLQAHDLMSGRTGP